MYYDYDNDVDFHELECSSGSSSPAIRRKEEFVYIPYSSQLEQSLTQLCCEDQTPVMLRSEKAQQRPPQGKLKRFTGIIYGYSLLFLFLAIHSFMTWSNQTLYQETKQDSTDRDWNHPGNPLFSISQELSAVTVPSSLSTRTIRKQNTASLIPFDAFDASGKKNYVADPTCMKQSLESFGQSARKKEDSFWTALQNFGFHARKGTRTAHLPLTPLSVCTPEPGRGMEDEGGYKILNEKVQLAPETFQKSKLLCAVYSHQGMKDLARAAALTWGQECDGFLVFGDFATQPELGFVQLQHPGEESYGNMFQKVRSIWAYLHTHYLDQFDYFHLSGDDTYVIPQNLKHQLQQKSRELSNRDVPIFMGQSVALGAKRTYVTGGPGYSLNRKGLDVLVNQALTNCHVRTVASHEDRLISECLNRVGVHPVDSRETKTGEQTYHGVSPHTLYTTRGGKSFHGKNFQFWSKQEHPIDGRGPVGPKPGLEAAAKYSVSFHNLFHPIFMARVHTILHPTLCPSQEAISAQVEQVAASLAQKRHPHSQ